MYIYIYIYIKDEKKGVRKAYDPNEDSADEEGGEGPRQTAATLVIYIYIYV